MKTMRYTIIAGVLSTLGCGTAPSTMTLSAPVNVKIVEGVQLGTVYRGTYASAGKTKRFIWFGNRDSDTDLTGTWVSVSTPETTGEVDIDSRNIDDAALIFWTPGIDERCRTGTTWLPWLGTVTWTNDRKLQIEAMCSIDGTALSASIDL